MAEPLIAPEVYLEKLSAFSRVLRQQGLPVSLRETEDAARVLICLGFAHRQQVKTALCTVYAKSREEQQSFGRVFDGFFLSEEAMRKQAQEAHRQQQEQAAQRKSAERDLEQIPIELTEDQKNAYAAMAENEKQRLRDFMNKYRGNAERNPELYGNFIHSVFARSILEQQMLMDDAALGAQSLDPEIGLMYRDISQFRETEIPKAIHLIRTVAQQINGELSAKKRSGGHTGILDFRRTIRKGLQTGGSLRKLCYRHKRRRRKQLVLLCDVSGSMVQFSEFALRFIQSLNQVSDNSRTFLFSEKLAQADAFSLQDMDSFRDYVRRSGIFGRGTDLGTALESLCAMQPAVLNSSTTLVILSDTKTVDRNRAVAALQEAKRRAGRVIWLNPIPESKWKYIQSVGSIAAVCTMLPSDTLSALAHACRRLSV